MNFSDYLINNRPYTSLSSLANEFNFEKNKNYLFELSYLSALKIIGERAAEFLQGQVSCDVLKVTADKMQQGAMCNLKGRVLALFDVIQWNELQLILASDLLAATQFSLTKTAMLSRVKLEISTGYRIYGFYLTNPQDLLPLHISLASTDLGFKGTQENCCYRLDNQLYMILIKQEQESALIQPFMKHQQIRGSLVWHYLQLSHKHIEIYPETRGLFLPHRLDLHLSSHLSFDKGCYKGQEIVARTHYRAKLKHGLKLFSIETDEPLKSGKKLFVPNSETEVGELIDYCPQTSNCYLVAASILHEHPDNVLIEAHKNPVFLKTFL